MTIYDSLGRTYHFAGVKPSFLPAGGLELRYAEGEDEGGLAAYFPAGGWVAIVEDGVEVEIS